MIGWLLVIWQTKASDSGYQMPSSNLAKVVDAELIPESKLSADGRWLALLKRSRVVALEELTLPEMALAGIKFNPATFMQNSSRVYSGIELKHVETGSVVKISGLPLGKLRHVQWASNSQYISFIVEQHDKATLWLYDIKNRQTRQITTSALNGVITHSAYSWLPDSSGFVVNFAVNHGKPLLSKREQQDGPIIQQSNGVKAPARTYQNLLKNAFDEAQFKFFAQGQLAKLSLDGRAKAIGKPTYLKSFLVSPDSTNLIVGMIDEPFSYQVRFERFAAVWQVWGMTGFPLYELAKQPLAESIPQGFDSVRTGPRAFQWRQDKGATVIWAEAQDGGDMKQITEYHDYLYSISAPFKREPELFAKVKNRFSSIQWADENIALLNEWQFANRLVRTSVISPRNADDRRVLFSERSYNDAYKNPGRFIMTKNDLGANVLKLVGGRYLFLRGNGASQEGSKPFLDRYDVKTNSTTRLWQSSAPYYERVRALLDDEGLRFITLRESELEQPNFFIRDLTFDSLTQLTRFKHPYPEYKGITKTQIKYKRSDGTQLTGNLYLPANYDSSQGPLPVLMWAYPLEYKNKQVASQVRESPYAFPYIGYWGPMPYLANGIAVFDDPKMPIIGEGTQLPNNNFRSQLVSSAKAAVDVLVEQGIADPKHIAIGGHSYGAFMVANLLAHSDLFVAGIARSGAYNRSLTPFGFQGEERDFWQAQNVYSAMSPFFHVDKINEPLLMIHGAEDPNSGTFPMQSQRMYAAMKGLGKDARLVMMPHEGHSYRARESILHVLWEQEQWLKQHLTPSLNKKEVEKVDFTLLEPVINNGPSHILQ
jgi:dipeptidyl aminopeptidase/acylaminoacyl peptidase